jgi:hypothetical protein
VGGYDMILLVLLTATVTMCLGGCERMILQPSFHALEVLGLVQRTHSLHLHRPWRCLSRVLNGQSGQVVRGDSTTDQKRPDHLLPDRQIQHQKQVSG